MRAISALPSKQKGFSILTGFILAIIMFGSLAFFLAGQGVNASFGASYSNTAKASSLLTSAGYIKTGFDSVLLSGIVPGNITFDATASTGMFNPNTGGAIPQPLDPTLFVTGAANPRWIYRSNAMSLENVGGTASAAGDYAVIAPGLKLSVCQQINNLLHGTPLTTPPGALSLADAAVIGTVVAPNTSTTAAVLTGNGEPINGNLNGCYITDTDLTYVYVHTLLAQQ